MSAGRMARSLWIPLLAAALGGCCWQERCASVAYRDAPDPAFCTEIVVRSECLDCSAEPPPPGIRPLDTGSQACEGPESCADLGFTIHCPGDYWVRPPSGC
jgi:hypothetical protein